MDDVERAYMDIYICIWKKKERQIARVTFVVFEQDDYSW